MGNSVAPRDQTWNSIALQLRDPHRQLPPRSCLCTLSVSTSSATPVLGPSVGENEAGKHHIQQEEPGSEEEDAECHCSRECSQFDRNGRIGSTWKFCTSSTSRCTSRCQEESAMNRNVRYNTPTFQTVRHHAVQMRAGPHEPGSTETRLRRTRPAIGLRPG